MILTLIITWYVLGMCGYIWWWTSECAFTISDIPACLLSTMAGLLGFITGCVANRKPGVATTIINQRLDLSDAARNDGVV